MVSVQHIKFQLYHMVILDFMKVTLTIFTCSSDMRNELKSFFKINRQSKEIKC